MFDRYNVIMLNAAWNEELLHLSLHLLEHLSVGHSSRGTSFEDVFMILPFYCFLHVAPIPNDVLAYRWFPTSGCSMTLCVPFLACPPNAANNISESLMLFETGNVHGKYS